MSVAQPAENGCRLVRIKRVPSSSSDFQGLRAGRMNYQHRQHAQKNGGGSSSSNSGSSSSTLALPAMTFRKSAGGHSSRIWINQRHSDVWPQLPPPPPPLSSIPQEASISYLIPFSFFSFLPFFSFSHLHVHTLHTVLQLVIYCIVITRGDLFLRIILMSILCNNEAAVNSVISQAHLTLACSSLHSWLHLF